MKFAIDVLAGAICGILSGFGLGGGSILLVYLSHFASVGQAQAQGINLIYFIPTAAASLVFHIRNKLINLSVFFRCAVPGVIFSAVSAIIATSIEPDILRKFFGIFLVISGVKILFSKNIPNNGAPCKHG